MNTLRFGTKDPGVATWQAILNEGAKPTTWTAKNPRRSEFAGAPRSWPSEWGWPIDVDGDFGARTEAATEAWQDARGLLPDGIVGANTWSRAMAERAGDLPTTPAPAPSVKAVNLEVGARVVDSYPYSLGGTAKQAAALKASGIDGLIGYLGVISKARVDQLLDAGLSFGPVTLANRFDGAAAVQQAKALGMPAGVTVWLDVEGTSVYMTPPAELIAKINAWATAVKAAGYIAGIYVGSPQPLTSEELQALGVTRYWNALSREVDRFGKLAEPSSGWCLWQMNPSVTWRDTGVFVDVNIAGQDFLGRIPSVTVRG
ncbi:MAG: DUF1906 domain-containing protein [Labilithrix sp.]|nr:DUF1906 domain-containing protein [Labilithrix sp.]